MQTRSLMLVALAVAYSASTGLEAGTKAKQVFRVQVPPRVSITAPHAEAQAELLPDATRVQFAPQLWGIAANSQAGATVQFSTEQCFHHVSDDAIRCDATLQVSIHSQSDALNWEVIQAQATTSYAFEQEAATVLARSHRPGSAVLGVTVTFLQGDEPSTPPGDYVTTVVGTLTAN